MRLRKKKYRPIQLFESIDEVIRHNWEQLSMTGDPKWLIKHDHMRDKTVNPERFKELFFKLHDEYSTLTGGSETMEQWSILMVKRLEARARYAAGEKQQINFVNLYTGMIDSLMEGSDDVNIIKSRMIVQQLYGQNLDVHVLTVPEYEAIVDVVRDQQQQKSQSHGENN